MKRANSTPRRLSLSARAFHRFSNVGFRGSNLSTGAVVVLTVTQARKSFREFNRSLSQYLVLASALGTSADSQHLRDELRAVRCRAVESAKLNKVNLLNRLSEMNESDAEKSEYETIVTSFISCVEYFVTQLLKTIEIYQQFRVASNYFGVTIQNGVSDAFPVNYKRISGASTSGSIIRRGSIFRRTSSYVVQGRRSTDGHDDESEKIAQVVRDMNVMVDDVTAHAGINPWAIEPDIQRARDEICRSLESLCSSASIEDVVAAEVSSDLGGTSAARKLSHFHSRTAEKRTSRKKRRTLLLKVLAGVILVLTTVVVASVCIALLI